MGLQMDELRQAGHHIWCRNGSPPADQRHTAGIAYESLLCPKPDFQAWKAIRCAIAGPYFQLVLNPAGTQAEGMQEPSFTPAKRNPRGSPGWLLTFGNHKPRQPAAAPAGGFPSAF